MNRLQPLHRVFCWTHEDPAAAVASAASGLSPRSPHSPVAPLCLDHGRCLSRADFAAAGRAVRDWLIGTSAMSARAAAQHAVMEEAAKETVKRVLIYLDDPFDFLCAVFGTLAAGCQPVLPAHDAPAYWEALAAADAYDLTLTADSYATLARQADPQCEQALSDMPIDAQARLTLFTSGSTGMPKPIHKTLAQLDAEVQGFAAQWGDAFDAAVFQASVPHHHIYGMTFFLLWPLAAGGVFDRARCSGPGDWCVPVARERSVDAHAIRRVIVSTPPQLARWPGLSGFDAPPDQGETYAFLSAGAPLSHETACDYLRVFGTAPFEIYGSTETGAIATRQQGVDHLGDWWTPLPGQTVWRTDAGTLAVQSPHLRAGDDGDVMREGFVTADAVRFEADDAGADTNGSMRFRLGGRIDRIAKVSGKRVSLPEIEQALAAHPLILQAAAVTLTTSSSSSAASPSTLADVPRQRERIGVVIVLRDTGSAALFEQGRAVVIRMLRRHLGAHVDPAAVPHFWRFVEALPYDQRGKLPTAALQAAFASPRAMPEVLSYAYDHAADRPDAPPRWRYTMRVAASLTQFEGHFPIQPILPGVAQLHWAVQFAQRHVAALARIRSVEQLKFTAPIMPGATLMLTLTHDAARNRVAFAYESDTRSCATGLLCYAAETPVDFVKKAAHPAAADVSAMSEGTG